MSGATMRLMSPALRFVVAVGPVLLASGLASLATLPNIPTWYASLARPAFTPPNWVFGPVWTILYAMMAAAAWRIPEKPPGPIRSRALAAFFGQLALNAARSFALFGAHSPFGGLIVIVPLLVMILVTIALFRPLDRLAARLLVPYAAWVAYAAVLNAAIWRLNPG